MKIILFIILVKLVSVTTLGIQRCKSTMLGRCEMDGAPVKISWTRVQILTIPVEKCVRSPWEASAPGKLDTQMYSACLHHLLQNAFSRFYWLSD